LNVKQLNVVCQVQLALCIVLDGLIAEFSVVEARLDCLFCCGCCQLFARDMAWPEYEEGELIRLLLVNIGGTIPHGKEFGKSFGAHETVPICPGLLT
jgi:hypothetical protein